MRISSKNSIKGRGFLKKILILASGAALCAVTFCGTFSGYVSGARIRQGTKIPIEAKANGEKSAAPLSPKMSNEYIVGEKNGKIILFRKTEEGTPLVWEEYDSDVSALPRADKEELADGIAAESLEEALQIIEDFTS